MRRLNLNEVVKFRFTPMGVSIYYREYGFKPKVDEEGYTHMQLWSLMQIIGDKLHLGAREIPIENLTILIPEPPAPGSHIREVK